MASNAGRPAKPRKCCANLAIRMYACYWVAGTRICIPARKSTPAHHADACGTTYCAAMGRMVKGKPYFTVLYGLPLGYIVSYYFQPAAFRSGTLLPEYIKSAPSVLGGTDGVSGVCATAWLGITICMSAIGLYVWRFAQRETTVKENVAQ